MDIFSRRIVGWWADKGRKENLIIKIFDQALEQRQPKPDFIGHPDRAGRPVPW